MKYLKQAKAKRQKEEWWLPGAGGGCQGLVARAWGWLPGAGGSKGFAFLNCLKRCVVTKYLDVHVNIVFEKYKRWLILYIFGNCINHTVIAQESEKFIFPLNYDT